GLGFDRQLSRRTYPADQPLRRTKNHGPTVVAQLPETEGHLGTHLRVEPATLAPGEESMTRIAEPQLGFADLELRNQGVHLDLSCRVSSDSWTTMPRWSSKIGRA